LFHIGPDNEEKEPVYLEVF